MLIKEGWRCRLDGWRQTEHLSLLLQQFPPVETERMASLTQIASLERTIYYVQDRRNLFANIWKTFMGSSEDLKPKKHNYILLELRNWDFILEISIFQLEVVMFSSIYCCFLPDRYEFQNRLFAVGLSHKKSISWQSRVFEDITHASER